ncbi:MAG: hypothetical protein LBB41_08140 [Prevotellaceae bacterium]|jgi:hypothetical protein|nr:hypothetical protein [Prevotellaceae bacterium]
MRKISNQSKIFGLTMSIVCAVTFCVFSFSGNWLKSLIIFAVILLISCFVGITLPFGKNKENQAVTRQQIWKTIIVGSIVFPVVFGLVFWILRDVNDSMVINFQRVAIAIVLSFIADVIGNLLFVREFRSKNAAIEN